MHRLCVCTMERREVMLPEMLLCLSRTEAASSITLVIKLHWQGRADCRVGVVYVLSAFVR